MGLSDVKEEIKVDAEKKRNLLLEKARTEAAMIKKKAEADIESYRKEAEAKAHALLDQTEKQMHAAMRIDAQRMLQEARTKVIDNVFAAVRKTIAHLPAKEKKAFLRSLLKKAQEEIDVAAIIVHKDDLPLLDSASVESASGGNLSGGLIAQSRDGNISINLSMDELLETARSELLGDVSEVLFPHED